MDILTQKQTKKYDYISRYSGIYFYYNTLDDKYMYGITKQMKDNILSFEHTVKKTDTLDSLAEFYYGRPDFFWVIADFNRIQDPFINLYDCGFKTINIPNISSISSNFKTKG